MSGMNECKVATYKVMASSRDGALGEIVIDDTHSHT